MTTEFELVGSEYKDTSEVPRDTNIFYRCKKCDSVIPSVPKSNLGCTCGNVFIDRDYMRLAVDDFSNFEVLRKVSKSLKKGTHPKL